ncbi:MAG: iron-containing alcohol dehydrogenase [Cytophagales bacterium]|nr:iron-containing alcohol dehydrogenase [Cytophagales bacterium]
MFDQVTQYNFPTVIRFGIGASKELPAYLKSNNLRKPLVVTDPMVYDLPFLKAILKDLETCGVSYETFSHVDKNPVKANILAGGDIFSCVKCDAIIGIGGGAAMDVARAIALRINNRRDLFEYDDLIGGDKFIDGEIPHLITIPTTSGTGSEVGRAAIISENDSKRKRILFHPTLLAKIVFADPGLTFDLPPNVTAATGMDALTHNMEAYISKGFHPMCDGIALEGIGLIADSLEGAVLNPNPENRSKMMLASLMGAVAFQKGLGIVHSLAHPLSTLLDVHHGLANAVMIAYGMAYNMSGSEDKFKQMARALKLKDISGNGVLDRLKGINERIGIPSKLSDLGVLPEHVDALSELALTDFCLPSNPKDASFDDLKSIYQKAILK